MGEVTQAEFDRLRREVAETRILSETVVRMHMGSDAREEWTPSRFREWLSDEIERREFSRAFDEEDGVARSGIGLEHAAYRLLEAGMPTLAEVAARPRGEIAAIEGVGRASMKKLDAALSERELAWAEAS